jgi:hypothetical protein
MFIHIVSIISRMFVLISSIYNIARDNVKTMDDMSVAEDARCKRKRA